jgi:hypothetical protein
MFREMLTYESWGVYDFMLLELGMPRRREDTETSRRADELVKCVLSLYMSQKKSK